MATSAGGPPTPAIPAKFQELEEKLRQTVELVVRLRHDRLQLARKHQEAEQRIAELEGEVKRLMAPRETPPPATDDLRDGLQLARKHQEAEQRIAELEGEVKRLMAERQVMPPALGSLLPSPNTSPDDHQGQTVHRLLELLSKEPANVTALFELGNIYERQGMYEKAILEYRKALNIDADFVDATEHLAFLLEKLNRDNEASPLWERILSLKKRR